MNGLLPFDDIRAATLAQARHLLADWSPQGRITGNEFKIGSIRGEAGSSLSVNLNTGIWKDFAANERGGDLIDLRAAMRHGGDIGAAARELAETLGIRINEYKVVGDKTKSAHVAQRWQPMVPPPNYVALPREEVFNDFDAVFEYTDAAGFVTHYVGRIEGRDGRKKMFIPVTYGTLDGKRGWHRRRPSNPLPLYGLNRLTAFPEATVILCEGEKSADAAQALLPGYACLSYYGGTGSVDYADLAPLRNREVVIWPDADEAGLRAASKLSKPPAARTHASRRRPARWSRCC
jgi:putative DNA primase/helicase